ncbi:MAG: cell division protein FtsZ [Candidatus Gribaldobacteria bacterium]|nr:cell division protein FtsZ [Candidatus Gribaldobacteria bacterium]
MPKVPKIKVVGIGGAGVNAVNRMQKSGIAGVDLIAVNTDIQSLNSSAVEKKILIGEKITAGLGAGMDVKIGEKAARESYEILKQALNGSEMIFLTCGLGGGTGSSGIPILGEIGKQIGALTVAIVTLPFSFEGTTRKAIASCALKKLQDNVDSLLVIANDKLLLLAGPNTTVENAFWLGDSVLREAVKGISDLISLNGIISVNLADLRNLLENSGKAFLGIGQAKGEKRATVAANMALNSPLLDFSLSDSQGILLNISGGDDLSLAEVNIAASFVKQQAPASAKIIFGVSDDPSLPKGDLKITVIATAGK